MPFSRPGVYPNQPKFEVLKDAEKWANQLTRSLIENDRTGEQLRDRAPDANLKALIVRPEWYGAKGDGATDDTVAVQAALSAMTDYSAVVLSKAYKITSVLTLSSIDFSDIIFMRGGRILATGCSGIRLSSCTRIHVRDAFISLSARDWVTDQSGIELYESDACDVGIVYIENFQKGVYLNSDTDSVSYNRFMMGQTLDCKYGVYLKSSATGAVTENTFYNPRFGLQTATKTATSGSYGLYMDVTGANGINNIRLYSPSFESLHNGAYLNCVETLIDHPRFEAVDDNWLEGTVARGIFLFGYGSYDATYINLANTSRNNVFLGKDADSEMSIMTEGQYGGVGFLDTYGRNVIHKISSLPTYNFIYLEDAANRTQYLNKSYEDTTIPTTGTFYVDSVVWNSAPGAGGIVGWICTAGGTMGTLAGVTFSGLSANAYGTANTTAGLYVGAVVSITGVSGAKRIIGMDGTTIYLSSALGADVSGAAVAYSAATWLQLEGITHVPGSASTYASFTNDVNQATNRNWVVGSNLYAYGDFHIKTSDALGGDPVAAGTTRFLIDRKGNWYIGIGSTEATIDGTNAIVVGSGSAPTAGDFPIDSCQFYSADITAGNAAPHFRTEAGDVVKLYKQVLAADLEEAYQTPELDTEAEVMAALNATNAKINDLITALQGTGLLAAS